MWINRWGTECSEVKSNKYCYFCPPDGRCVSPYWWKSSNIYLIWTKNWLFLVHTWYIVSCPSMLAPCYWLTFFTINFIVYCNADTFTIVWLVKCSKCPTRILPLWMPIRSCNCLSGRCRIRKSVIPLSKCSASVQISPACLLPLRMGRPLATI